MTALAGRVEDVDALIEKVRREIEILSEDDPELAAGWGTDGLGEAQKSIDQFLAAAENLDIHVRKVKAAQRR